MKIGRSMSLRAEAVGGRIELGMALRILEAERVEIGREMAADAVGADHHQGADRIEGRLAHLGGRYLERRRRRAALACGAVLAVAASAGQLPSKAETISPLVASGQPAAPRRGL